MSSPLDKEKFKALCHFLLPFKKKLAIACLLQTIAAIAGIIPFVALVHMVALLETSSFSESKALVIGGIAFAAVTLKVLCSLTATTVTHFTDNDFQFHMRSSLAKALPTFPLMWFSTHTSGSLKKNLQEDVSNMHHLVAHFSLDLINALILPLIVIVYLGSINFLFMLIVLVPVALHLSVYIWQASSFSKHIDDYNYRVEQINNATIELVQGIEIVKVFPREGTATKKFHQATTGFLQAFTGWVSSLIPLAATSSVLISPLAFATWIAGAGLCFIYYGWLTPLDLLPFLLVGAGLVNPLTTLSGTMHSLHAAMDAAARVATTLSVTALPLPAHPQDPVGVAVKADQISFSYDGIHDVLTNISFTLPSGSMTALVGPSGSGKSTLAHLLLRFADPTSGNIFLGDVNLRDIPAEILRKQIGFIFQHPQMLRTSILDNIRLSAPNATLEEVQEAAHQAIIHDCIIKLPNGYNTVIGDETRFSGGELQRIAIARALLARSPILILDEATAFADASSEEALQESISRLTQHKTLLVIAHRLHTIVRAQQILVLNQGHLVEQGTHNELVTQDGLYAEMWKVANEMSNND